MICIFAFILIVRVTFGDRGSMLKILFQANEKLKTKALLLFFENFRTSFVHNKFICWWNHRGMIWERVFSCFWSWFYWVLWTISEDNAFLNLFEASSTNLMLRFCLFTKHLYLHLDLWNLRLLVDEGKRSLARGSSFVRMREVFNQEATVVFVAFLLEFTEINRGIQSLQTVEGSKYSESITEVTGVGIIMLLFSFLCLGWVYRYNALYYK